mgnify:FL=1
MANNITYDDPWGDNIQLPYKDGKLITGKEADKYSPFADFDFDFQHLLYKMHTKQKIDINKYSEDVINKAIAWYGDAEEKAIEKKMKYKDNEKVMNAQDGKLQEIDFFKKQLSPFTKDLPQGNTMGTGDFG